MGLHIPKYFSARGEAHRQDTVLTCHGMCVSARFITNVNFVPFHGLSNFVQYVYIYIYIYIWPPLWSSGQSFWLQIQGSRIRLTGNYKKKVVGLERGPLSLVSTTEELLDSKVAASV
jgi:hypothetical protein